MPATAPARLVTATTDTVVIGGGAVGLSCGFAFHRAGHDVMLIERGRCGHESSLGNAGWVTPALSVPLGSPGAIKQALKWMLRADSPFLIRPRLDRDLYHWLNEFRKSATADASHAGTAALLTLNRRTFELFDEMLRIGVDFEMHRDGILFVARSERGLRETTSMFEDLVRAGYTGRTELLGAEAIRAQEPALAGEIAGGLFAQDERHLRPESFTRGLRRFLVGSGMTIVEDCEVTDIRPLGGGTWGLQTSNGTTLARRVVVASGIWSKRIVERLGLRLCLEPAKGYSVTARRNERSPQRPLYLVEAKVGCSPFEDCVRLAGTLELGGMDGTLSRRRLDAMLVASSSYMSGWHAGQVMSEWAGLRPLTPDGLPLIGRVPDRDNVYVATGHGMLGMTLAPATGEALLAQSQGKAVPELDVFRPERFSSRRPRND